MIDFDLSFRMKRRCSAASEHGPRTRGMRELFVAVSFVVVLAFAYFVLGVRPSTLTNIVS